MALIFRGPGPWGSGQGSNLSAAQADNNIYTLSQQISSVEAALSGGAVVSIESISVTANQMTVTLTNGVVQGPFTLPVAQWNYRGVWQPSTAYAVQDVITGPDGNVYLVLYNHTSGTTFNAGANDGMGHSYYGLLLQGVSAQWATVVTVSTQFFHPNINSAGNYHRCTFPSPGTIIQISPDAAVNFQINTEMHWRQVGGPLIFETLSGAPTVLNIPAGFLNQTDRVGATVTTKKVGVDQWDVFGLLAPHS